MHRPPGAAPAEFGCRAEISHGVVTPPFECVDPGTKLVSRVALDTGGDHLIEHRENRVQLALRRRAISMREFRHGKIDPIERAFGVYASCVPWILGETGNPISRNQRASDQSFGGIRITQ